MALLTTGNFYTLTFLATTDGAWAALSPNFPGGINGALASAIYLATPTPVTIYVIDSASGLFAYEGGQAFNFDDTLINPPGSATLLTKYELDAVDGTTSYWGDDGSGDLLQFDSSAGVLRRFTGAMLGGYQAFIAAI